jgi:NAD(P)-dependent dehydrogenase (short-subunit alcohol dehydrogenase family)
MACVSNSEKSGRDEYLLNLSLENEVVVVTGGAKRLGRAIALECARGGASVAITYNHSQSEAQSTLDELKRQSTLAGQNFAAFKCEVSNRTSIEAMGAGVLQTFDKATALVNNAAIFRRTPFAETNAAVWESAFDEHIAANLKGPYLLSKHFGDLFLQQERGSIVNIADIHALRPLKNYAPYCASKAGVVMLTEVLAKALAPHVRVNCICPGTILVPSETQGEDDDLLALQEKVPMQRLGTPEEIAQAIVFLIGGPQFINGAILPIDGAQRLK